MAFNKRIVTVLVLAGVAASLLLVALPSTSMALPAYATATGQACGVCHVAPGGGGPLTALGTRFAAIPTHTTDPAGAFAQASAAAAPTAAPTTAPAAAPTAAPTTAPAAPTAAPTTPPAKPTAAATTAPVATATATAGTLPRTGGFPLPVLPAALLSLLALAIGVYLRRK